MLMSPAKVRCHFLTWERPWLQQAVAWLARDWPGTGPIDLSRVLAIVPTRHSGRRLREALADFAAARGTAVFAPQVNTPDALLTAGAEAPDVASRLESLLAWTEVFREVDLADVPDVFPIAPARRDFGWAWQLAESFFSLQTQLTEGGLSFADVAGKAGAEFPEARRWAQLAWLEEMQIERLAKSGRRESHAARREFAMRPGRRAEIENVVLLAAPDPLPLAIEVLKAWSEEMPIDVLVFAPEREAEAFDGWGRPKPEVWAQRALDVPEFERRVRLCADPAAEAQLAAEAIARYAPAPEDAIAVAAADAEVLPLLENALSRAGVRHYNPEGRSRRSERWHALLLALAAIAREPTFEATAALARCPDFLAALKARGGDEFSIARFLEKLDDLRADHLPADLAELLAVAVKRRSSVQEVVLGLELIEELRRTLGAAEFPENVAAALGIVFRGRRFDLERDDEAVMADAAEAWREVMRECAQARERFPAVSAEDWWDVALRLFGASRRTTEKPPGAIDLQGWLELLWEDAPHLIVAGMNDGFVPDAIVGDVFLPEALRVRLGLKTNGARFARDAYILQAIAASRQREGRLDILFAKHSAVGDPRRPSRLLLRCDDAVLPERIRFLFRGAETARTHLSWRRAWRLSPRRAAPPERVAVTGLRAWLACPFRFYLQHVLRMEAVDPAKSELDARDFGTVCHAALEAMARAPALRDCTDEKVLRDFLLTQFDAVTRERFGAELTLPLVVQLESARQRLGRAAAVQARDRSEGWVIERAEWTFDLEVAGLKVRGKIDRCDRHEASGTWRVLDYKTTDSGPTPHKAHVRSLRAGDERRPEWMRVDLGGREHVWADLQLPLYLRALGESLPGVASVECGYFNLPKAIGETAIQTWSELTPELLTAAGRCAEGVATAIKGGEFWPPMELAPDRDAFAALFHHGAEDSVAWEEAR